MEELWQEYLQTRSSLAREELILHYAPVVRRVVGRMMMTLPATLDMDDLLSYGSIGLIDAVEKFDPNRGIKFETYAVSRIRGTIYDELRALDWIPRSIRQKAKELERAYSELEHSLGRSVSDEEIAEHMGKSPAEIASLLDDVNRTSLISLDDFVMKDGESTSIVDRIEDKNQPAALDSLLEGEMVGKLSEAIEMLPEREKTLISLYYYEKLTLKEIGKVLEITESRVCQIHTRAVMRLRDNLKGYHTPGE
jgi:RNA polymerase sigma factor for flagellar operon FliA